MVYVPHLDLRLTGTPMTSVSPGHHVEATLGGTKFHLVLVPTFPKNLLCYQNIVADPDTGVLVGSGFGF